MDSAHARVRPDWTALVAGLLTVAMDAVYVSVIGAEGEGDLGRPRVQVIAASLALAAGLALGAWAVQAPRLRLGLLAFATFTMLAWGLLGMFSIGAPVFIAGILLLFSVGRATDEVELVEAWGLTAVGGVAAILAASAILATT